MPRHRRARRAWLAAALGDCVRDHRDVRAPAAAHVPARSRVRARGRGRGGGGMPAGRALCAARATAGGRGRGCAAASRQASAARLQLDPSLQIRREILLLHLARRAQRASDWRATREHFRSFNDLYLRPSPLSGPSFLQRSKFPRQRMLHATFNNPHRPSTSFNARERDNRLRALRPTNVGAKPLLVGTCLPGAGRTLIKTGLAIKYIRSRKPAAKIHVWRAHFYSGRAWCLEAVGAPRHRDLPRVLP